MPRDQKPATFADSLSERIQPMDLNLASKPVCRVCGLHIEMPDRGVRYSDSLSHWSHIASAEGLAADRDHEALR
jgi:hypothetical protein